MARDNRPKAHREGRGASKAWPESPCPCPEAHPGRELAWPLGYRVPPKPPPRARSTGPPRQGGQSTWRSGGQEQAGRSPGRQAGHGLTPGGHPPVPALVPGGRSVPHPQEGLTRARRNRRRGACRTPAPRKASAAPGHAQEAWLSWVGQPLAVQPPSRVRLCWAMVGDFRPGPAQNSCSWPRKWPTSWLMT